MSLEPKVCPITANHIKIALVGQPNVGKSMLINSISNANLHVGNFSGVTVEKSEVLFDYKDYHFTVVDLPGTYALNDYSIEEKVTSTYLTGEDYDMIINVVDSTNLQKNLQLTAELMSLGKKIVIALNMTDEADKEGMKIDDKYMSQLLNIPCVKTSAQTKLGIEEIISAVIQEYEKTDVKHKLIFSESIEEEIAQIVWYLDKHRYKNENSYRNIAINLLKNDKKTYADLHDEPIWTELQPILIEASKHIELHNDCDDIKEAFALEYNSFTKGITTEILTQPKMEVKKTLTEKIDNVLIHPVLGIPIFLFLMWSLFQLTFEIGSVPMEWIDAFFIWFGETIGGTIANDDIRSFIVDGIISGVGAVVMFVPNIVILFIGIALLEGTGYMSRVAFYLMDFFINLGFMDSPLYH